MNNKEMSDLFDTLYNNITSNQAPGLNEFEKSVFLTKAQSELVKNYFVPQGNAHQTGFDGSQKRQMDFSLLMKTFTGNPNGSAVVDPRALVYQIPADVLYIINESMNLLNSKSVVTAIRQVKALSFDEYERLMSKPFKEPVKYQAWRLMTKSADYTLGGISQGQSPVIEIILTSADKNKFSLSTTPNRAQYILRYVKKPRPIILENFSAAFGEDLSIDGKNGSEVEYSNGGLNAYWEPCELDKSIHEEILQRAVELAKVAWSGDLAATIQTGQRSE